MGIDSIEISPSGQATCKGCGKKIGKGTPRGVIIVSHQSYGSSSSYVCYKCALEYIQNEVIHQLFLKKELAKKVKESTKEIIAMEL